MSETEPSDTSRTSFADLATRLTRLPGPTRIVAIDGHGGAGKSTFAERLVAAVPPGSDVVLLHTDEFARPDQPIDWWPRLRVVLQSFRDRHPATFRLYDWTARSLLPERTLSPPDLLLIEGVSSSRSEWQLLLDFSIWIETSASVCRERGTVRDGVTADEWAADARHEQAFFAADGARDRADLIVDGHSTTPQPELFFTILER